jgi:hypothetical protein
VERGEIGVWNETTTVFIFEDLIAQCVHPRMEKAALSFNRWEAALGWWEWDVQVLDHMHDMMSRYESRIEVYTWRPPGFAEAVYERLWQLSVEVAGVTSQPSYQYLSHLLATDNSVTAVFDADPAHRHGYGFKGRAFVAGAM